MTEGKEETAVRNRAASTAGRIASWLIGLMMLSAVVLSVFYIAAEAGHDCTGEEDCPVCACIQQCENTLRRIGGREALSDFAAISVTALTGTAVLYAALFSRETPVSGKVRLNN